MTHPHDFVSALGRLEVALESTCDALMTVQSIDVASSIPEDGNGEHVARAIAHLRHAVDELREAQAHRQNGLALGFVLARDERRSTA